jgi:hypothetical protein
VSQSIRELYRSPNGDAWFLEESAGSLFVVHQPNMPSGGSRSRLPVEEFLRVSRPSPEREALVRALPDMSASELDEDAMEKVMRDCPL